MGARKQYADIIAKLNTIANQNGKTRANCITALQSAYNTPANEPARSVIASMLRLCIENMSHIDALKDEIERIYHDPQNDSYEKIGLMASVMVGNPAAISLTRNATIIRGYVNELEAFRKQRQQR